MSSSTKRTICADDLYQFELISGTRIAPDGKQVIYSQQRIDRKTEKKYANLWVTSCDGGPARQFTFGDHSDVEPCWSPEGNRIAFLSNRGNPDRPAQIYILPFSGGEARPLTDIHGSISDLSWSPDGKQILCTVRKSDPETIEMEKDEQKKKLGVIYRHVDRVFYKLDGVGYLPKERTHIWTVDAQTGDARQLTDHPIYDEQNPVWSPDGKWIAFVSNRSEQPDFFPDRIDLYLMPAQGGEIICLPAPVGYKGQPSFSPDGKRIAYYGYEGEGRDYRNMGLWVTSVDGSLPPVNLTQTFDLNVSAWTINDLSTPETMPPTWSNDNLSIYFPVTVHGSTILNKISVDGKKISPVINEGGVVGSFSLDRTQKNLVYFYGTLIDPGQLFCCGLETGQACQVTNLNQALLQDVDLGHFEEVWYKGADQNDLQGWILYPPGFDPSKKYPSILQIHGGPLTQYGAYFMHEFYTLAAQGYIVFFTNPRGGRGYGEEHAAAIWGDWGNVDYADLMAWTDLIAKKPFIDPDRMGVAGGSYGGYMTVWIIGHTHRFKAAVTMRCVSNLVSMWGSSDFNWSFQEIFGNRPPFEDLAAFWDHSPIKYIGNARTPTLVIHNEMDLRCPIEQGEQVFVALKRLGVECEMVRFPDEFHGLSRDGRTDRRVARLQQIVRWFDRYLKN